MKNQLRKHTFLSQAAFAFLFLLFGIKAQAQLAEEDFDNGIPATWDVLHNDVASENWEAVNNEGFQGSNAVAIDPSVDDIGPGNTGRYFLVTPQFPVPENGLIRFYTKRGPNQDNGTQYEIRISTANQPDINGFNVTLQTWTEADLSSDYTQKVVQIPSGISAGLNVYIAFVAINPQEGDTPSGTAWYIDNVDIVEGCAPLDPDNVTIDNITTQTANITWMDNEVSNFEVAVVPTGDPVPSSGTAVSGSSYTFTGLEPDSTYDAYIKTICDNGSESAFVGPFTFTTQKLGLTCDSPIVIPDVFTNGEYELQDNLSNYSNPDLTYTTQGSGCLDQNTNYLNGDKIFFSYTPSQDGLITLSQESPGYDGSDPDANCYNGQTSILIYESCSDVGENCLAATHTTFSVLSAQIQNFVVDAGHTYIIVMSSELSPGAGICFDFTVSGSSCAPPSGFSYDDMKQNSVKISWENPGGFADSWEYVALPEGTGPPTGSGTSTSTNIDNEITGLDAGTTYDFYVRSICDGTPGEWSDPYTFTTQCSVFSTPYEESFDGATDDNPTPCWYTLDANNDGEGWGYLLDAPTIYYFDAPDFDDYLVSPAIDLSGGQKRLKFTYEAMGGDVQFEIVASTNGIGPDNFSTVVVPNQTYEETGFNVFEQKIIVLPTSMNEVTNFAWHVTGSSDATRLYIDDVVVEDLPACSNPVDPQVDTVTQTSATFSWDPGYQETQWEVIVQDDGDPAPSDSDTGTLTSDNPYTAEDLTPGHQYEYYVRAHCNDQDQSEWVGPIPFITDCASYDTPFYESFNDDDPDTQKFCWETIDNNGDSFAFSIGTQEADFLTPFFGSIPGFDDYLISPAINVSGEKVLSFKYKTNGVFGAPGNFGIEVMMSTTGTDPDDFTTIEPLFTFQNANYLTKYVSIDANGPIYIAFHIPSDFSGAAGTLNIDDVRIDDGAGCVAPTNLHIVDVNGDSAELAWDPGFAEPHWDVVVQPQGTGLPPASTQTADTSDYTVQNLEPGTAYEAYVRSNCGDDVSDWVGPITFTTPCLPFDTPFQETFNSDSPSQSCWTILDGNSDGETWNMDIAVFPYQGDESAGMFTGQNGNNNDWLISPQINITSNQRIRFYYRAGSHFYIEDLQVMVSTTGTDPEDFTSTFYDSTDEPDPIINNEEYKEKIINLPDSLDGQSIYIAFHVPQVFSAGPVRGQSLFIDDVNVEPIPDCASPSNITITNIADTQFDIDWEPNGDETSWEVAVVPYDLQATPGNIPAQYITEVSAHPYTATGLDPAQKYDVFVRAACSDDSTSEWTGPETANTLCDLDNLCQYTVTLFSGNSMGVGGGIDVIQDDQTVQTLEFPTGPFGQVPDPEQYTILLCTGAQFSLYWNSVGTAPGQYPNSYVVLQNFEGDTVWQSEMGIGTPRTVIYSGVSQCGEVSCPQPIDLTSHDDGVLSWTPQGDESSWEVAVQPVNNGTIPQSGTVVTDTFYTPTASDFIDPDAATYEYFVRAICSETDSSYWSGPYQFVRNDNSANAVVVPVNDSTECLEAATNISFTNAHHSANSGYSDTSTTTTYFVNPGTDVDNPGTDIDNPDFGPQEPIDVWFSFEATSPVHIIEANRFSGNFYVSSGDEPYPDIQMILFKENDDGSLEEITQSDNNVIVTNYNLELTPGDTYKIELTLKDSEITTNTRLFQLCITTPHDLCDMDVVNGGFEHPPLHYLNAIGSIITQYVVPGWRTDFIGSGKDEIFLWNEIVATGFAPYEGGQCVQLISDAPADSTVGTPPGYTYDENDPHGLYKDVNSSEVTTYNYSFAYQARNPQDVTVQLFAGPPGGPYTLVTEKEAPVGEWAVTNGSYQVPEGQDVTRFMFTQKNYGLGMMVDDAHFKANNEILTQPDTIPCTQDSIIVKANGVGTWIAHDDNPGTTTILATDNDSTAITGFSQSGTYTYTWKTRYCEHEISFEVEGVDEVPEVDSLVTYCQGEEAEPLTATEQEGYTLVWFTSADATEGSTEVPTPSTATADTTSYYVAYKNEEGCIGAKAEIEVVVHELTDPVLDFSYDETCILASENPTPILSDDFTEGGEFSATDLPVDSATGEIDLANATAGTYEITYTLAPNDSICRAGGTATATIIIDSAEEAHVEFDYPQETYCLLNNGIITPVTEDNFTEGGTFSTEGTLDLDSETGAINLSTAEPGTYNITYSVAANDSTCTAAGSSTVVITLDSVAEAFVNFHYPQATYCLLNEEPVDPVMDDNFTSGGVFSSDEGLALNSETGEIELAASEPGEYQITYTVEADSLNCRSGGTHTVEITLNPVHEPQVMFHYPQSEYCILDSTNAMPVLADDFTAGGTFSAPEGLDLNPETGEINVSNSSEGTYQITYTLESNMETCTEAGTYTTEITLTAATQAVTDFSYPQHEYCMDQEHVAPVFDEDLTPGGTFTAEPGLVIDPETGEIDITESTPGEYTVTYTVEADELLCESGGSSSFTLTIYGEAAIEVSQDCEEGNLILTATADNTEMTDINWIWTTEEGETLQEGSNTLNVNDYLSNHQSQDYPLTFVVEAHYGDCSTSTSYQVTQNECTKGIIPEGISPNQDGYNDSFDLSFMQVRVLEIFNRYGTKVYQKDNGYTNQWFGQDKNGNELPAGTYYYIIKKQDGHVVKGWVYVTREN